MKEPNNNSSQDIGQGLGTKPVSSANKGIGLAKKTKLLGKLAKPLKGILTKIIGAALKWLVGLLGPYVLLVIMIIILLLLVIQSVISFDFFQEGSARNDAEEIFDNAINEVFKDRLEDGPSTVKDKLRNTQQSPYPVISENWLQQTGEMLKQSIAIPTIHHYFKNLENDNYKPWHKDYSDRDASNPEALKAEFKEIINEEFAYYFNDSTTFEPTYTTGEPPFQEYIKVTTVKKCKRTNKDGTTKTTTKKSTETNELPKREIVKTVEMGYLSGSIPYQTYHVTEKSNKKSGNCTSDITTEKKFYIVDDGKPMTLTLLPERLVEILTLSSNEGKRTQNVQPQDLEYAIDLGQEIDKAFPEPDIDYSGLTACYYKNKGLEKCIGKYTLGGSLGSVGMTNGWYPTEYEELYKKAANACGIDWYILAAVHGQETGYGSNPVATDPTKGSYNERGELVGAVGHFQFMPLSWVGWRAAEDFETTPQGNLIGDLSIITDVNNIAKYGGRGMDANNDGVASPWDVEDAAFSAACYLKSIGYQKDNEKAIKRALALYNGGNKPGPSAYAYADEVYSNGLLFNQVLNSGITVADGDITYPTVGRITSHFGGRELEGAKESHYGLDIANVMGTPIVAIADGQVEITDPTGNRTTWGKYIRIKHNINGQQFYSISAHLSEVKVKPGDPVKKGTLIGLMGNTGRTSGPTGVHLHIEIHSVPYNRPASAMNPLLVIPTPPSK